MPRELSSTPPLHPERLTWAVMLGRWVDFARASVALPAVGDSDAAKLRGAVPDLIMLQAVWFALQHVDELEAGEKALGLDRATVLIEKHAAALRARWGELPAMIAELIQEAEKAVEGAGS
jgi:hypothetical protein